VFADAVLEGAMRQIRQLATLARAAREEARIKVRQPLSRMVCVVPEAHGELLDALVPLLATEVNIKQVEFAASGDALVRLEAKPNFRALGKRFGKRTPLAAQAVGSLSSEALAAFARGEEVAIAVEGDSHVLLAEDLTLVRRATGDLVVAEAGGFFAALDPTVTPELRREGLAREVVSQVQRMRKEAGMAVSDRISLHVSGAEEVEATVRQAREYITSEVLAVDVRVGGDVGGSPSAMQTVDLDGLEVRVAITRVS
jgi:isoleucyl-tRNA synthetase